MVMMIAALFAGCEGVTDNDEKDTTQSKVIRIGETVTDKQISVKAAAVRLVDSKIIVIDIEITNNRAEAVSYSSFYAWGTLKTPENTQLETITYLYYGDEIPSFSGSRILSGVTVKDTISFEKYTPVEGEYIFYADPPLPGDFDAEKINDFQIKFDYKDL
jgi:hypothetical protein